MLSNDSWLTKFEKTHEAEGAEIQDTDRKTEKEKIFLRKNQKGKFFAFTENSNAQTSWSKTHVAAKQGSMENKAKFMKAYLFYISNKFQIVNRKNLKEKHWEDECNKKSRSNNGFSCSPMNVCVNKRKLRL